MITSGFQSLQQHAALFTLISWRLLISRPSARFYADRKSLFELLNSFDNRGTSPPAALSLTFAIAKSFFGALYNTSAIIGSSRLPNVQVDHIKHLLTLDQGSINFLDHRPLYGILDFSSTPRHVQKNKY